MPGDPEVLKRVMKLRSDKKITLKEAWAKVKKSLPKKPKETKEKKPSKEKKPAKEKKPSKNK